MTATNINGPKFILIRYMGKNVITVRYIGLTPLFRDDRNARELARMLNVFLFNYKYVHV